MAKMVKEMNVPPFMKKDATSKKVAAGDKKMISSMTKKPGTKKC